MEIISQHTKKIMEECKKRALDAGLVFDNESLEYIVTNQDMIELVPKGMIPTLYNYWVNDLEIIKGKKEYEIYPNNPYETVINSRPALSFYNDNNPDWLNVMIFYHVLGHIDFMQNNIYFRKTWEDDFVGQALADKRLISNLRSKYGRWVDYVIEFSRGIDNITGFYQELSALDKKHPKDISRIDYFFKIFLQKIKKIKTPIYLKEIDNYNTVINEIRNKNSKTTKVKNIKNANAIFLSNIKNKYPEFETIYEKHVNEVTFKPNDIIQYIMKNSDFLNNEENKWMLSVMAIVRNTALHFEPQRRTKTINEGWATYWHNELFIKDDRIKGHESDFARINALVTSVPIVGYNPYAIGYRLFEHLYEVTEKGKLSYDFEKLLNRDKRRTYNNNTNKGKEYLLYVRENFNDFTFINSFVNQDFTDKYNLVLIGERINQQRMTREYYIKSKKAADYKNFILGNQIHPPHITVSEENSKDGILYLTHHYEGKQLIREFIDITMIGLEYLWGNTVKLETYRIKNGKPLLTVFTVKDKKVTQS